MPDRLGCGKEQGRATHSLRALGVYSYHARGAHSPRWDDTGVSAAMVLTASGLMGTLHPQRAWVWAFAVGWWIPLLGIAFDRFDYASLLALVFGLVGAYAGAFTGKRLTTTAAA